MTTRISSVDPAIPTKIGIVGSKEVGKTALSNLLTGHLKSLGASSDLVHESARKCPLPLNEKTTLGTAFWLFGTQIAAEALVQETRQFTICDRTVLDLYPFALYSAVNTKIDAGNTAASIQQLEFLKTLIKHYIAARPYEFLFYIPIRQGLWSMHSPPDDPSYQAHIDIEFRRFLSELQIDFVEITNLDVYKRLEEVMSILKSRYRFLNGWFDRLMTDYA